MLQSYIFSLLFFYVLSSSEAVNPIYVKNGTELIDYLCDQLLPKDAILILNDSVKYVIYQQNRFCHVRAKNSITIMSNSSNIADIKCKPWNHSYPLPTSGFSFYDVSVNITNVKLSHCGAELITLNNTLLSILNSSQLYYSSHHSATLLFVDCIVAISFANITTYYGFAVLGINIRGLNVTKMLVSGSINSDIEVPGRTNGSVSIGSGMMLHFYDESEAVKFTDSTIKLYIENSHFHKNADYVFYGNCITEIYYKIELNNTVSQPVVNAAGLTLIFNQKKFNIDFVMNGSHISRNGGTLAGGMLIFMLHTTNAVIHINNSLFDTNINLGECYGSGLVYYFLLQNSSLPVISKDLNAGTGLSITNTYVVYEKEFQFNSAGIGKAGASALSLLVYNEFKKYRVTFHLKNVTFHDNVAELSGSCLMVSVYGNVFYPIPKVYLILESILAYSNSQAAIQSSASNAGMFSFSRVYRVDINGSSSHPSMFYDNYGSVIEGADSQLYLNGYVVFARNIGRFGGALSLTNTYLTFLESSHILFSNNTAQELGGAIYAYRTRNNVIPHCAIGIASNADNLNVTFSNNTAVLSGNSIFAYPLYWCYLNRYQLAKNSDESYRNHFYFVNHGGNPNDLFDISTEPCKINHCKTQPTLASTFYPGETIRLNVTAQDVVGHHTFATISIGIAKKSKKGQKLEASDWQIPFSQYYQIIQESKKNACSTVSLTIQANTEDYCSRKECFAIILFSSIFSYNTFQVLIVFKPCPLGFHNHDGVCVCDPVLSSLSGNIQCYIDNQTIYAGLRYLSIWVGEYQCNRDEKTLAVTDNCPIGYCGTISSYNWIQSLPEGKFALKSTNDPTRYKPLCLPYREGILCGQCKNGLSVVFGSRKCMECSSNWWLLTIILYVVAGPLLIYLLYALRLTLTTGTLNGIIFYAQAANCGLFEYINHFESKQYTETRFADVLLSILNLNLGFPLCFYNGMTELWKAGLSLLFPLYLLTIVVVLIILSRFSLKLSNRIADSSVQVLVTVIHLSFSKLLLAIIDVFTLTVLYTKYGKHQVWLWDGSVDYLSKEHMVLMSFTIFIVFIFIVPYLLLLVVGRVLFKCRIGNKLRPFYEAMHGPYKENKRFWFTVRLFVLIFMYAIFASLRGQKESLILLLTTPILVIFTIIQAYIKPFKKKIINILDVIVMVDFTMIYVVGWYGTVVVNEPNTQNAMLGFALFSNAFLSLLFLVVLIGHILWVTGKLPLLKHLVRFYLLRGVAVSIRHKNQRLVNASNSYYGSCSQFREPILEY